MEKMRICLKLVNEMLEIMMLFQLAVCLICGEIVTNNSGKASVTMERVAVT